MRHFGSVGLLFFGCRESPHKTPQAELTGSHRAMPGLSALCGSISATERYAV